MASRSSSVSSGERAARPSIVSKYLFKLPTTRKSSIPKVIPTHIGLIQADVMYLKDYGAWAGGYNYVLNVIDSYSRYCWSFPIKKLRKADVRSDLISVIDQLVDEFEVNKDDIVLTTDQGTEFSSQSGEFEPSVNEDAFDVKLPVKHLVIMPEMGKGRTVLVERLNRTLHEALRKIRFDDPHNRSGETFVTYLEGCVEEYNNRVHTTTKATPRQIITGETIPALVEQNEVPTFDVGDAVLVQRNLGKFEKRSAATRWNPELWRVTGQIGWRYTLEPWNNSADSVDFEDQYGYMPLGSQLQLVKPGDIDTYLSYESPTRVTKQLDDEAAERRRERRVKSAQKQIGFVSKTQKQQATPSSSKRTRPSYKDML